MCQALEEIRLPFVFGTCENDEYTISRISEMEVSRTQMEFIWITCGLQMMVKQPTRDILLNTPFLCFHRNPRLECNSILAGSTILQSMTKDDLASKVNFPHLSELLLCFSKLYHVLFSFFYRFNGIMNKRCGVLWSTSTAKENSFILALLIQPYQMTYSLTYDHASLP